MEGRNLDAMVNAFAENAVLNSPVSFKPIQGRPGIRQLLSILLSVFEDFHYTDQLESKEGVKGLVFRARVAGRELQGIDLLRFNEAGLICELTVMVRPKTGIEVLQTEVGKRLEN